MFDGDGTGEVADIVGLVRIGEKLRVLLVHCKHSAKSTPGARIDDFYAVCGQAQKSVHWRENPRKLLKHLLHQEELRLKSGGPSRFERGGRRDIQKLISSCRELSFAYEVAIVQPGLSKVKVAPAFLDVLGATETFLQETFSIPLQVIARCAGPVGRTAGRHRVLSVMLFPELYPSGRPIPPSKWRDRKNRYSCFFRRRTFFHVLESKFRENTSRNR